MKKRTIIISIMLVAFIIFVTGAMAVSIVLIEADAHIYPNYPRVHLEAILAKPTFSGEDYKTLFHQTGLGRPAIDELRQNSRNWAQRILQFQEYFFAEIEYVCEYNSPISKEESIVDESGNYIFGTELAPLHEGYILVTKSSHTYGWRNGHSALVVDAAQGKTLESAVLGSNSIIQGIDKWPNYPNFILLRPKDCSYEEMKEIADTAVGVLLDIPYDLTVGVFSPKLVSEDKIRGTHCSHLIWLVYSYFGYDLDSDGGIIVTPNDIVNSPELEIVQVYGVDPRNIW